MSRWFSSRGHICVVGALVLAMGVWSLVDLIGGFLLGDAKADFSFLAIWVGLGLLRGSSGYRGFWGAILVLWMLGMVVLFVTTAWSEFSGNEGWTGNVSWWGLLIAIVIIFYQLKVLNSAKNDGWFSAALGKKVPEFVVPVTVVVTVVFAMMSQVKSYEKDRVLEEIFPYDLEIVVKDAKTGEFIESVGIGQSGGEIRDFKKPGWMNGWSMGSSGKDGVAMTISGYARGSMTVNASKEGYRSAVIEVNQYSKSPLVFELESVSSE